MNKAACACGRLRAEAVGEPYAVVACHCRECQRRSGSPFGVGVYFTRDQVTLTGAAKTFGRAAPQGRRVVNSFCPDCGTSLYWASDLHPDGIAIALGCFEGPGAFAPNRSVWEQSRLGWIGLPDALPGLVQGRGSTPTR